TLFNIKQFSLSIFSFMDVPSWLYLHTGVQYTGPSETWEEESPEPCKTVPFEISAVVNKDFKITETDEGSPSKSNRRKQFGCYYKHSQESAATFNSPYLKDHNESVTCPCFSHFACLLYRATGDKDHTVTIHLLVDKNCSSVYVKPNI
uniref:Nanos-type domain-containing protein n=1 Tax=Sinocyclocheilus rhinocerous TaxID=307959 RepID=A0A673IDT7_9TELE